MMFKEFLRDHLAPAWEHIIHNHLAPAIVWSCILAVGGAVVMLALACILVLTMTEVTLSWPF